MGCWGYDIGICRCVLVNRAHEPANHVIGPDAGAEIKSLAQTGTEVFASGGDRIIKCRRGKEVSSDLSSLGPPEIWSRWEAIPLRTERSWDRSFYLASNSWLSRMMEPVC